MFNFLKREKDNTLLEISEKVNKINIDLSLFKNPVSIGDIEEIDQLVFIKNTHMIASAVCDYVCYGKNVMIRENLDKLTFYSREKYYAPTTAEVEIRCDIEKILSVKAVLLIILKSHDDIVSKENNIMKNTQSDGNGIEIIKEILKLIDDHLKTNHSGQYVDVDVSRFGLFEYINEYISLLMSSVLSLSNNIVGIVKKHIDDKSKVEGSDEDLGFVTYITGIHTCKGFSVNYDVKGKTTKQYTYTKLNIVYPEFFSENYADWLKDLSSLILSIYYL